jgi:glycosyltransferase involved in cell wall biosynthesis
MWGGLKEAIEKRGTGIVVDTSESGAVAKGIVSFFEDGNRDIYIKNIEQSKEALSWESFAKKITDYYHTLI